MKEYYIETITHGTNTFHTYKITHTQHAHTFYTNTYHTYIITEKILTILIHQLHRHTDTYHTHTQARFTCNINADIHIPITHLQLSKRTHLDKDTDTPDITPMHSREKG